MYIEKKIKLMNNIYFVIINVEYKKSKEEIPKLKLLNGNDDYYDDGDLSNLIKKIEEQYTYEQSKKYDKQVSFMADILYIYDRIPILSGLKNVSLSKDNLPVDIVYISKDDINKYINENKITMSKKSYFKLCDERTWHL